MKIFGFNTDSTQSQPSHKEGHRSIGKLDLLVGLLFISWLFFSSRDFLPVQPFQVDIEPILPDATNGTCLALAPEKYFHMFRWNEQLSLSPPRPEKDHKINAEKAEKWINAFPDEMQRKAAKKLIEATHYISFVEFERALQDSVEKFNRWLENEPSRDYVLIVSDKGERKSDRWVAELALPYLKILPKQVFSGLTSRSLSNELLDYYHDHPEVDKYVFFDDGAYSGLQTRVAINKLFHLEFHYQCYRRNSCRFEDPKIPPTVIAVIPFIGTLHNYHYIKNHSRIFTTQRFPLVADALTPDESRSLGCDQDKVNAYFQHKLADSISTCYHLFRKGHVLKCNFLRCEKIGEIPFIDPIDPPYKQIYYPPYKSIFFDTLEPRLPEEEESDLDEKVSL